MNILDTIVYTHYLKLFEKYDMEIFDCERISSHGGSIRVYAASKGQFKKSSNIESILNLEKNLNLSSIETYKKFANRVYENKNNLLSMLKKIKSSGKTIVGISAPARSSTVLNFCNIDSSILDYVAEKSPLKLGKFTPGMHIEVVDDSKLIQEQPDYALLLSWHLADSIISKIQNDGYKGKIIVPLPIPKII